MKAHKLCFNACYRFCRACSTKMTKRPTDHPEPAPKKRSGDRQISREEPPSDDDEEQVCKAHNSLRMHLSAACILMCAHSNITEETVPTYIAFAC